MQNIFNSSHDPVREKQYEMDGCILDSLSSFKGNSYKIFIRRSKKSIKIFCLFKQLSCLLCVDIVWAVINDFGYKHSQLDKHELLSKHQNTRLKLHVFIKRAFDFD